MRLRAKCGLDLFLVNRIEFFQQNEKITQKAQSSDGLSRRLAASCDLSKLHVLL
jgi:hypothetical protein